MAVSEKRAAAVRFPLASADNTNGSGVQRIACTGAAQTYALKADQKNRFIYVRAIGVEIQCAGALTAQSLVLDQVSSAAAGTASAAAGATLSNGDFWDRLDCDSFTHLCWISRSAAGYLEFFVSEG